MLTARIREGLATGPASAAREAEMLAGLATDGRQETVSVPVVNLRVVIPAPVLYIEPTSARHMQYAGNLSLIHI